MLLNPLFPSHPNYMVGHTALGLGKESPDPFDPWMVGRGLLFQVLFHPMT